jgi:hypothetical protein
LNGLNCKPVTICCALTLSLIWVSTSPPEVIEARDAPAAKLANIVSVNATGTLGAYTLSVGIQSPDLGCQQYADWWEVLGEEGALIYRRILTHSHVDEQPFVRSGGPVPIPPDQVIWVRAHMHPGGYGGTAFKGSVQTGFVKAELSPQFAADLAKSPPLPQSCTF